MTICSTFILNLFSYISCCCHLRHSWNDPTNRHMLWLYIILNAVANNGENHKYEIQHVAPTCMIINKLLRWLDNLYLCDSSATNHMGCHACDANDLWHSLHAFTLEYITRGVLWGVMGRFIRIPSLSKQYFFRLSNGVHALSSPLCSFADHTLFLFKHHAKYNRFHAPFSLGKHLWEFSRTHFSWLFSSESFFFTNFSKYGVVAFK